MRIVRFQDSNGKIKPGVLNVDGSVLSVASVVRDWNGDAFSSGMIPRVAKAVQQYTADVASGRMNSTGIWKVPDAKIVAPVTGVGKIVCIGLNDKLHAKESGMELPQFPKVFFRDGRDVIGAFDDIRHPRGSNTFDWEVELAVALAMEVQYLKEDFDLSKVVAGITIGDELSMRNWQFMNGPADQWTPGKQCPYPLGPHLVTLDEIPNIQKLRMRLWVNGILRQDGNTENMVFDVHYLLWYLSQRMKFYPGDVVSCGTPKGVGFGMKPPQYLKVGDVVEVEIEGLGKQRGIVVPG